MSDAYGEPRAETDGYGWAVVVGVDGDSSAVAAVDLAVREAATLGVPLRFVHANQHPPRQPALDGRMTVDSALERVAREYPELELQTTVVAGGAGAVLVDESGRATLLVLGGLNVADLAEVQSGSVLAHVLTRAHCPVVVTGPAVGATDRQAPVCVAVDGSASSLSALRFGCDWAARHGSPVEAINVVSPQEVDEPAPEFDLRTPAELALDGWVKTVQRHYPSVTVQPLVVHGVRVAEALVRAGQRARLVAVGAQHSDPPAGPGSGWVDLIREASCPVAVVHGWHAA